MNQVPGARRARQLPREAERVISPPPPPASRWRRAAPVLIVLALVAIAYGDLLIGQAGLFSGDLTSYHYPMKSVVRNAIGSGDFPYWNPHVSAGQPLAANPAYELFYPLQLPILLPSFAYGFQLHIVLHFLLAAAGMYFLIRSFGAGEAAAAFGALSFAFGGAYLSLSSMLPLLFSLSWLPLSLLFARRWIRDSDRLSLIGAAFAIGMQMILGEPTMALQSGLFIGGYAVFHAWRHRDAKSLFRSALPFVLAAGLAAIQLVPAVDFARDTVRSRGFEFRVTENWSMPLLRPVELLFPSVLRNVKNDAGTPLLSTLYPFRSQPYIANVYAGWLVMILALAGVIGGVRGRGPAMIALAGSLILAAGSHTPLLRLLYDIGIARSIRFPEKFVVGAAVVLAIWSALVLHEILAGNRRLWTITRVLAASLVGVALIAALAQSTQYFALVAVRSAVAAALVLLLRPDRRLLLKYLVLVVSVADLWLATRDTVQRMPGSYFTPKFAALDTLPSPNGTFRVFHDASWAMWYGEGISRAFMHGESVHDYAWIWRNSAMPNLPAARGYELVLEDDIDQTSLLNTTQFREAMKAGRSRFGAGADTAYMKMSNVRYRIVYRQATEELVAAARTNPESTIPVEVVDAGHSPRHWFATALEPVSISAPGFHAQASARVGENVAFVDFAPFVPSPGQITGLRESANALSLRTRNAGRGFLVIGVTGHRWWRATIDGAPARLEAANIAYQGLVIPPGEHEVELRYHNPLVMTGAIISALSLLVAAAIAVTARRRARWGQVESRT